MIVSKTRGGGYTLPFDASCSKNSKHSNNIQARNKVVATEKILKIDLKARRIFLLDPNFTHPTLPTSADWTEPSPIYIKTIHPQQEMSEEVHCTVGGISSIVEALYILEGLGKGSKVPVIYITDGKDPISLGSGHQAHAHPTEHASDDCSITNLFKAMLQGMGLMAQADPNDLDNYSYLHLPISASEALKSPLKFVKLYGSFFTQRLKHNYSAVNGLSETDRKICEDIRESLDFHEALSHKIEAKMGVPTFKRDFRIYWSTNLEKIEKRERLWKEAGIRCERMSKNEIRERTLFKTNEQIYILKIYGDGHFFPETPQRIIDYMLSEFPNFKVQTSIVSELHINDSGEPVSILEVDPQTQKQSIRPITSFFCSPGHNEVFKIDEQTQTKTRLWEEVPVSGVSTLWECKISIKKLEKRLGRKMTSSKDLKKFASKIVASANLSNLHITPISAEISSGKKHISFLMRATQGANFNKTVADPRDLENMIANLEKHDGKWTAKSISTCTRKTWKENAPEVSDEGFAHGFGGIGYSISGKRFSSLRNTIGYKE